jgi:hypothetical protein
MLGLQFFKYILNFKTQKDWKLVGRNYFQEKLNKELFETKIYIIAQSKDKNESISRIKSIFNNFLVLNNYPLNQFNLKIQNHISSINSLSQGKSPVKKYILSSEEITSFFHFPSNPK